MKLILSSALFFLMYVLSAQFTYPKASPFSKLTQDVGLTNISIEYSRPAVNGRRIFGDLVPFGRIWRVGANESTKFTLDTDILVKGEKLSKGTYALYAFPEAGSWQIVFHKNTSHWGDGRSEYDPGEDELRVIIVPDSLPYTQENFLISFDGLDHNSAVMQWSWENTIIRIPIEVPTDELMMVQIEKQLVNTPTAQTYYEAGRYLQEQQKMYPTALEYLENAIVLGGDTYYFHRIKSLVEAGMGTYDVAILSAELSLKLAREEKKDEFVRMNKKNIIAWKKLLKKK